MFGGLFMACIFWLSTAVISILLELYTYCLIFVWVAVGAIATCVISLFGCSTDVQLVSFTVVAVITFFIFDSVLYERYLCSKVVEKRIQRNKGKLALCTEKICLGSGKVLFLGNYYKAKADIEIPKGAIVRLEEFNTGVWRVEFVNLAFKNRPTMLD